MNGIIKLIYIYLKQIYMESVYSGGSVILR